MTDPTAEFFTQLGKRGHDPMLRRATGSLRFDLADRTSKATWSVALRRGDVSVSRSKGDADCIVAAKRPLFDAVVRGETNAMAAVLRGEISVEGDSELLVLFQRVFAGPADSVGHGEHALAGRAAS
jgi:ubiquinone biosynthesis protein UbiJ